MLLLLVVVKFVGVFGIIYDVNVVFGCVNCFLVSCVQVIVMFLLGVFDCDFVFVGKIMMVGMLMCLVVFVVVVVFYVVFEVNGLLCLLVVGGSQGVCIMVDIVLGVIEWLEFVLWS